MSILTARSAAVLNLAQIDQTLCADCNHPLKDHLPKMREDTFGCHEWRIVNGRQTFCACKSFADPSERLAV